MRTEHDLCARTLFGRIFIGFLKVTAFALTLSSFDRAEAGFETQVMTAVEPEKTLPDLQLSVGWDRLQKRGRITREWVQDQNGVKSALDVKELNYTEITQQLLVGLRVGLYHDLEFHMVAPIVLQDDTDLGFAKGVSGVSTIWGSQNANDPTYPIDNSACCARYPITEIPASRSRGGFGDMTFGLAWAPVVDHKDEAFPTLTFRGDIIAPTGKPRDPTDQAALPGHSGGSIGSGAVTFDLSMGLSKRMREATPTFDPYMIFAASIPVPTAPSLKAEGYDPPPTGRFLVGAELIVDEDPISFQRYSIDLSFGLTYVGSGRTFSELSDFLPAFNQRNVPSDTIGYNDFANKANYRTMLDGAQCGTVMGVPCGELTHVDEYLKMTGTLAFNLRPARYAFFRAGVSFGVNTDHLLTTQPVGTDLDPASTPTTQTCDGAPCVGRVNAKNSQGVDERSPYYDPRFDSPGHRFRIEETTNFTVFVQGAATF
jgi:hypothetical protein